MTDAFLRQPCSGSFRILHQVIKRFARLLYRW